MKKFLSLIVAMMIATTVAVPSFAVAPVQEKVDKGVLVSERVTLCDDGETYLTERIYVKEVETVVRGGNVQGTRIITDDGLWTDRAGNPVAEATVSARATYSNYEHYVDITDERGEITNDYGFKTGNEKIKVSGSATKKTVTFSFARSSTVGNTVTHSLKVSCDENGKQS